MSDDGGYMVERLKTERERLMIERDLLRARLTDTERKLREERERCERLEGILREVRGDYAVAVLDKKVKQRLERIDAALSEPDEMMQEGKL